MLISEFLALVPGPKALVGAVIESRLPGTDKHVQTLRISGDESINRIVTEFSNWHIVERPPRYQDPTTRYCAWCETKLYKGYNPGLGLVEGWCPDHGPRAQVLHEPTAKEKRHLDTLQQVKDLEPKLKKMVDTIPGLAAFGIPRKVLEEMENPLPSRTAVHVMQAQSELVQKLGFAGIDEFKRLAGVK